MKFEHVILGLLSWRPFSGYELGKYLEREGRFIRSKVHLSQIYRLLSRMVDSGWVCYEVQANDGRPDSKIYRLTEIGEQVLREWVASPYEPPSKFTDSEFLVRFHYGGPLDRAALLRLVRTELETRKAEVSLYRDRDRSVGPMQPIDGVDEALAQRLGDLIHEQGAAGMDLWINWLERVLAELESEATATQPDSGHR
ncbi:PadR family transcriptional regulator [Saccharopolyspora erythraea]|uniref:PadR family transcriptional regulator n=1 Tax=Saccharopolyspora erythraea TaxID=1836 RepID=UPI001BAD26E7|nr:PadR family transcriptional regulator [Saccharopolyspora erythraea]QUH04167.1 PadR family transcriptional regulator [Saccharopolyspora erythraea]